MGFIKCNFVVLTLGVAGVLSVSNFADYTIARRVEVSPHLAERASFIGGWALGGGYDTCPSNTTACEAKTGNLPGTCCPTSTTCVGQGLGLGIACCPADSPSCGAAITSIPTCADPSWTLYNGIRKYFCCAPGYIGIFPRSGLNDLVGLCVPSDQNVPASNLATPVSSVAPKSSAASASAVTAGTTTAATAATSAGSSLTSAAATPTPTKNAGNVNSASLTGILGSAFGFYMVQVLL